LIRLIDAIASGQGMASTLSGARVVAVGRDDAISFERDAGERARGGLAALDLAAGESGVFDGRFEVRAGAAPVQIVPVAGCLRRLDRADRVRLREIPGGPRGALPVVIDEAGGVRLPAPFGEGPAVVRALVGQRFAAACGLISEEAQLATSHGMAL